MSLLFPTSGGVILTLILLALPWLQVPCLAGLPRELFYFDSWSSGLLAKYYEKTTVRSLPFCMETCSQNIKCRGVYFEDNLLTATKLEANCFLYSYQLSPKYVTKGTGKIAILDTIKSMDEPQEYRFGEMQKVGWYDPENTLMAVYKFSHPKVFWSKTLQVFYDRAAKQFPKLNANCANTIGSATFLEGAYVKIIEKEPGKTYILQTIACLSNGVKFSDASCNGNGVWTINNQVACMYSTQEAKKG